MVSRSVVQPHMEVLDKAGHHLGRVYDLDAGNRIRLTWTDPRSNSRHHVIPLEWVERLESGRLLLDRALE